MDVLILLALFLISVMLRRKKAPQQRRQAQPRRAVRPPGVDTMSGEAAPPPPPPMSRPITGDSSPGTEIDLEELIGRLFGGKKADGDSSGRYDQDEHDHEKAEREREKEEARLEAARREAERREREAVLAEARAKAAAKRRETVSLSRLTPATAPAVPASYKPSPEARMAAAQTPTGQHAAPEPAAKLAEKLRRNPNAAREAFVYAEIFGPPLADR